MAVGGHYLRDGRYGNGLEVLDAFGFDFVPFSRFGFDLKTSANAIVFIYML